MFGLYAGQLRDVPVTVFRTGDRSWFTVMPVEAEQTRGRLAMGNFLCQLDWATRCPAMWCDVTPRVGVRLFPSEVSAEGGR